jgi:type VI secretion system protein ImpE
MNASELFEAGQLQAAIDAQTQEVRAKPADQAARLFLFELMLYAGDVDRARKQIDVLRYGNPKAQAAVQMYKFALDAEQMRRRVLEGKETPKSLTAAPDHVMDRLEALKKYAGGEAAAGDQLLDQANAATPGVKATINGKSVEGLRDADDLFGTVLEVFGSGGAYCWVPLEQVESITMNPPRTPRDVLMIPANLTLRDGPSGDVLLPALYAGSHASPDDALRLGRATDWASDESRPTRGIGGKLFLLGEAGTLPLLHWRELTVLTG